MEAAAAAHTNAPADVVVAVADPPSRPGLSPFAAMNATGLRAVRGNVSIPGRNAIRALLDVYASGHECEEFWYTNVPDADNLTKLTGSCGGGPHREVEVMIDGTPAGAALPFPTIYSGGIVPQLWRPVAGIHSSIFHRSPLTCRPSCRCSTTAALTPSPHACSTLAKRLVVPRSCAPVLDIEGCEAPARRPNCNG